MAVAKSKTSAKPKREKISRAELNQQKVTLGSQLEQVYEQVMSFCKGAPPSGVVNGSYQTAIEYKDLVSKTRGLILNKAGSPNQLQQRINRLNEKLKNFKKFI